jgi:hypothetical protein
LGTGDNSAPPSTSGGSPCAPYDASSAGPWQYTGEIDFDWTDNSTTPPSSGVEIVKLSFDVTCGDVNELGVNLWITSAMPQNPPTSPSNQVQPGQGFFLAFPNGTQIGISAAKVGDFSVLGYASHISMASTPGVMPAVHLLTRGATDSLVSGHPNAVLTPKSWTLNSAA